jgi:ParB family transcriptional regulator, chromosome partitioning protein
MSTVPCVVMEEADDVFAIEASLAENIARLPMDDLDQFEAFAALAKRGLGEREIARHFSVAVAIVKRRLAIAKLPTTRFGARRSRSLAEVTTMHW